MELSAREIGDLKSRLEKVEKELNLKKATVSYILNFIDLFVFDGFLLSTASVERYFSFFDTFGSVQKVHGRGNSHEHFFEKKNRNYIYCVSFVITSRMVSDFIDRAFFFFCRKKTFSNGQKGLSSLWSTVF